MRFYLLTFAVFLALASGYKAFAQEDNLENPLDPYQAKRPIYLGPVFGYNRAFHSVKLKTHADQQSGNAATCPTFENGQMNGFYVGFSYEHTLGEIKNSSSSIIARVLYQTMPAYLESKGDQLTSKVQVLNPDGTVKEERLVVSSTLWTNEVVYNMVTAEVLYKLNPIEGTTFGFTVGPTFDYALTKTQKEKLKLLEPSYAIFVQKPGQKYEDGGRSIVFQDGDIPNSSAFRFGIKVGVHYEILLGKWVVMPNINYNFGVTNLQSEQSWKVSAIQAGFDIRYTIK